MCKISFSVDFGSLFAFKRWCINNRSEINSYLWHIPIYLYIEICVLLFAFFFYFLPSFFFFPFSLK